MSLTDTHPHPDPTETDSHPEGTAPDDDPHGGHSDPGAHGAGDGHGHGAPAEPLGPVDRRAWAAAIGGAAIGVVVILALYVAIQA
jgi:hypothetical protein